VKLLRRHRIETPAPAAVPTPVEQAEGYVTHWRCQLEMVELRLEAARNLDLPCEQWEQAVSNSARHLEEALRVRDIEQEVARIQTGRASREETA
jgi:hypothetical protein